MLHIRDASHKIRVYKTLCALHQDAPCQFTQSPLTPQTCSPVILVPGPRAQVQSSLVTPQPHLRTQMSWLHTFKACCTAGHTHSIACCALRLPGKVVCILALQSQGLQSLRVACVKCSLDCREGYCCNQSLVVGWPCDPMTLTRCRPLTAGNVLSLQVPYLICADLEDSRHLHRCAQAALVKLGASLHIACTILDASCC